MDGELCPRPFERGWRKESIAAYRKLYKREIEKAMDKQAKGIV
jgi:hypothetical protein